MMIAKPKTIDAMTTDVPKIEVQAFEKTVEGLRQGAATAAATMEQAQEKMKESVGKAMKTAEQFAHFGQGNLEAMIKSSQILASGFQDISKQMAASAKETMEETMSTFKAMSGVKSLKEVIDMQTSFAKASMEKAMAESGKLTEHSMKLAEQAIAPITARVNAAVETFSSRS